MPLPRFHRLPAQRQRDILKVARAELARSGPAFSYAAVISRAGISKTCAYLYFDGKEDLSLAVQEDLVQRLREVVQPWTPAGSRVAFFQALKAASVRLHQHLLAHPDDVALLAQLPGLDSMLAEWFSALVEDGVRLGLVSKAVPLELMVAATRAVVGAADRWALGRLQRGEPVDPCEAADLLKGLWRTPRRAS